MTDSRAGTAGDVIRRRRECETCARRFTTYERVEEVLPLVVKKDGRREPFDRPKVLSGLRRACDKRAIASERIEAIVDAIEKRDPRAAVRLMEGHLLSVEQNLHLHPRIPDLASALRPRA